MKNSLTVLAILALLTVSLGANTGVSVGSFSVVKENEFAGESAVQFKLQKIRVPGQKGKVVSIGFSLEQNGKTLEYHRPNRGKVYSDTHTLWHWSVNFKRSQIVAAGMDLSSAMNACVHVSADGSALGRKCVRFTPGGKASAPVNENKNTTTTTTTEEKSSVFDQAADLHSGGEYSRLFEFTNAAINSGNRDPRITYLRGYANLKLLNCEAAISDLQKATSMGLGEVRVAGGNDTPRLLEYAGECKRRLPLVASYPSGANYQVGVRYSNAGFYGSTARRLLPDLGKIARRLFDAPAKMVMIVVFQDEQEASDFRSATGVDVTPSMLRPDATGFGGDFVLLFNSRREGQLPNDPADTVVHEFIHTIDGRLRQAARTSVSPWWTEGLATFGTELHFGRGRSAMQAKWAKVYKQAGGVEKDRVLGGTAGFQSEPRYISLNYLSGALMMEALVQKKGTGIIKAITAAQKEHARFRDEFQRLTGMTESELFDLAIGAAQNASGLNFEDKQYEIPRRSTFRNGDLVLARNSYNRNQEEYLPAIFSSFRGAQASVYYLYGANSVVPKGDIVHLNWKQGVQIRCRIGDNYQNVTVRIATKKEVIYQSGGREGRAPIGSCNELGSGPKNR